MHAVKVAAVGKGGVGIRRGRKPRLLRLAAGSSYEVLLYGPKYFVSSVWICKILNGVTVAY